MGEWTLLLPLSALLVLLGYFLWGFGRSRKEKDDGDNNDDIPGI